MTENYKKCCKYFFSKTTSSAEEPTFTEVIDLQAPPAEVVEEAVKEAVEGAVEEGEKESTPDVVAVVVTEGTPEVGEEK